LLIVLGQRLMNPFFRLLAAQGARGDDRRGAAGRARRGAPDAAERPFDGHGRVPCRRAALGTSTFRTSSRPISSRSAASCSACFSSPSACRSISGWSPGNWQVIALSVAAFMLVKAAGIYVIAPLFRSSTARRWSGRVLMGQGGEFAFVLYSAAAAAGIFDARINAIASAIVILSMVLTPLAMLAMRF
jgi:glutathione-regulated potassium-efflux system protein KefB